MALDPNTAIGKRYVLSEEDRDKFRELWQEHQKQFGDSSRKPNPSDRTAFPEHEEHQAPEFHVAHTAVDGEGITAGGGGTVGYGVCDIYQVVGDAPDHELIPVDGYFHNVYTIGGAVGPDEWVLVARDKYGKWYVVQATESAFWAKLIYKVPGPCPAYRYRKLHPPTDCDDNPQLVEGTCKEVNGIDLPVPSAEDVTTGTFPGDTGTDLTPQWPAVIVRLYPTTRVDDTGTEVDPPMIADTGTGPGEEDVREGPFCLFEMAPRWEFVYKASDDPVFIGDQAYYPGVLLRFDQTTKELVGIMEVFLLDMTTVFVDA